LYGTCTYIGDDLLEIKTEADRNDMLTQDDVLSTGMFFCFWWASNYLCTAFTLIFQLFYF